MRPSKATVLNAGSQRGAALIIMAVILVLGSAYVLVSRLNANQALWEQNRETADRLGQARSALIGYALNTGCLPCPSASANSGVAQASCPAASQRVGFFPWLTLDMPGLDSWEHRLRYSVTPAFAEGTCSFDETTNGDIRVETRDATGSLTALTTTAPAVLVSHGQNGYGAFTGNGAAIGNPPGAHVDENTNRTSATSFVQRGTSTHPGATGGPFDDIVVWLPVSRLCQRLATKMGGWACP